jgi:hypothetical protein
MSDTPAHLERQSSFLARVRTVARECGYTIAVHGSEQRDLDLVAVPWTVEAVSALDLVDALCERVPLVVRDDPAVSVASPEPKPWGRLAWALHGCPDPWRYVDLSVAPRAGEPIPVVAYHQVLDDRAKIGVPGGLFCG